MFLDYNDFLELQDCTDLKLDFGHFPVYIFVRGFNSAQATRYVS